MNETNSVPPINAIEMQMIAYFSDAIKAFGLPKSVGEIYGLLYASPAPVTMIDIEQRLQISKGSASQGLKMLRVINAVHEENDGRKTLYTANIELKDIIGGIIKEKIQPHLQEGKASLEELDGLIQQSNDASLQAFYQSRSDKMSVWRKKSSLVLPLFAKLLGR